MPCKKKSISPLYFQIYTHLFTDNFFSPLCRCFEDVCVIFSNSTDRKQTFAGDWSIRDNLEEKSITLLTAEHYPVE